MRGWGKKKKKKENDWRIGNDLFFSICFWLKWWKSYINFPCLVEKKSKRIKNVICMNLFLCPYYMYIRYICLIDDGDFDQGPCTSCVGIDSVHRPLSPIGVDGTLRSWHKKRRASRRWEINGRPTRWMKADGMNESRRV